MASIDDSKTGMRKQTSIADLIVKGAIALVTTAFFIGAYLQFQVTFWLALISALSVYIALLMLHTLMRRSERVDVLASEVTRLEGELARVQSPRDAAYAPPAAAPGARNQPGRNTTPPRADVKMPPLKPSQPPLGGRASNSPGAMPPPVPQPLASSSAPSYAQPAAKREERAEPTLSPWPSATGGSESVHDYWSFRPEKASGPDETPKASKNQKIMPPQPEQEGDLEAVQGMIKRLAKEVSLPGESAEQAEPAGPEAEAAMRASLEALRSTAGTMRSATSKSPLNGLRRDRDSSAPMPPPIAPAHARLSSIGEAVAAGRMEARLDPIVGLADHQLHHYEVAICPRDEKGVELAVSGQDGQLAKTGLLPLIDGARLKWAAQISRSLAEEGPQNCVFTAVSAESLGSDRFLDDLAKAYRQREALAGELVLTFTMADIRTFGGMEWSALTDMRDLGFRFGLDGVTDLDYEFTALKAAGFSFVALRAADVLKGLNGPGGNVAGADICHQMNSIGLSVIVGGIADEATRTAVVKAGFPLGQGALFGPPATVTAETLSGSAAA